VLLDLDAARFEDALGLAGTQSAGLMAAQFEAMCKRMHHGFSARNGLYSALLAAGGYTGIKRVFERDYGGFLSVFGEGHAPDASKIAAGLGEQWETQRIAVKPYAAMGALHAPLDAIFDIMAKRPLKGDEIERIDIDMSHAAYHHGWWPLERPLTPIGAQRNDGYAVAVAILDGAAMVQQFSPQRIDRDDVWELIPRIEAHHDPAFDAGGSGPRNTRMTVRLKDGSTLQHFVCRARTIAAPLTNDQIVAKYRTLTDGIVEAKAAGRHCRPSPGSGDAERHVRAEPPTGAGRSRGLSVNRHARVPSYVIVRASCQWRGQLPLHSRVNRACTSYLGALFCRLASCPICLDPFSFPTRSLTGIAGSVMILTVRRELRSIDKWAIVSLSGASMIVTKS
jgi:hypothetical protein